jgi:predicted HAD superfamily Cof-like phosphohydrolase
MNDFITNVSKFMEAAGQTEGEFNVRQTALYIGLQCEELAEKMSALGLDGFAEDLLYMSARFKNGKHDAEVAISNRESLLDADVDLLWVTVGAALSAGFDLRGAMDEVTRSNFSKMVDGKMVKDENGKVRKPETFSPPLLEPFVCKK